jgi:hypothetical protein
MDIKHLTKEATDMKFSIKESMDIENLKEVYNIHKFDDDKYYLFCDVIRRINSKSVSVNLRHHLHNLISSILLSTSTVFFIPFNFYSEQDLI